MEEIVISAEFKKLIPPLSREEFNQLRMNIISDGCRDSLTVWEGKGILLDGHNRYQICTEEGINYAVNYIDLENKEDAFDWMDANQLGRRNLSPDDRRLLLGRRYNRIKKSVGAPVGNNNNKSQLSQSGTINSSTSRELAKEHGVSKNTILRAGRFADAVERIEAENSDLDKSEVFKVAREETKEVRKTRPEQYTGKTVPTRKIDNIPYCNGLQFARIAIEKLEQIQPDDVERQEAFDKVEEYINDNR